MTAPSSGDERGRVVLVGAGHAHLGVLRKGRKLTDDGFRLTVVTPGDFWYSGAATGVLAGLYPPDLVRVDVGALTRASGAELVRDRVVGADPGARRLHLASGSSLGYDVLSVNVGSVPRRAPEGAREHSLGVKPIPGLVTLGERLRRAAARDRTLRVLLVGGGASGCEIALALESRARREGGSVRVSILTATEVLERFPRGARASMRGVLARRGMELREGIEARRVGPDRLELADGTIEKADVVVDATGLVPPPMVEGLGLPVDEEGALRVDACLRSPADPRVFGAGDCVRFGPRKLRRVGVHAVRQVPVLLHNVRATLEGRSLRRYRPPSRHLLILGQGDGTGLAVWGPFWWSGPSAFWLKDWLDRRFLRRHTVGDGDDEAVAAAPDA